MNISAFRRHITAVQWSLIILCAVIAHCTFGPSETASSGGTGSEIVGTAVHDSSGMGKIHVMKASSASVFSPLISGHVFCYQRSSVPETSWVRLGVVPRAHTDSSGGFVIRDAPPGEVVVEASDENNNSIVETIVIDRDSAVFPIGVLVVKKTGAITLQARTQLPGRVRFYIGVKGTRLVVRGSQTNVDITLDKIPCGIPHTISIRVYEPIRLSIDIPNITVSSSIIQALGTFQIEQQ